MVDYEVVVLQFGVPPSGSVIELSWVLPECEVSVVYQYNKLVLPPCEVWPPMFQGFKHGVEFLLVDVVFLLHRGECGQVKCDGV